MRVNSDLILFFCSLFFWSVNNAELLDQHAQAHTSEVKLLLVEETKLWTASAHDGIRVHALENSAPSLRVPRPAADEVCEWYGKTRHLSIFVTHNRGVKLMLVVEETKHRIMALTLVMGILTLS